MPQVDLETLVCGGAGDGKVSCETLISAHPDPNPDPNFPPESVSISIQDSHDFPVLAAAAAAVYDRDDSAKESTNPKSQVQNPNPNGPSQFRSNSQRYAAASSTNMKASGPIFSLPNKIKHVTCSTSSRPRPQTKSRIFPKKNPARGGAGGKSSVPENEPSSPKVSCIGKVLSDREREKCRLAHRRPSPGSLGCLAGLAALFSCGGAGKEKAIGAVVERRDDMAGGNIRPKRRNSLPPEREADGAAAPDIGAMKRFASGRRAASWGGDMDVGDGGHVAVDLSRRSLDER